MKCLRCGRCCFYNVVVIRPERVKEDLNLGTLSEDDILLLDGSTTCPFLIWEGDQAVCKIHGHPWFKDTPCGQFTQEIEKSESSPCRTGTYMRANIQLWRKLTLQE